jgi:hypothetical protein
MVKEHIQKCGGPMGKYANNDRWIHNPITNVQWNNSWPQSKSDVIFFNFNTELT